MDIIQLVCPACGATLDVEDELDVFYCKFCGSKLIAENLDKGRLKARLRIAEMQHEERMRHSYYEYQQEREESLRKHQRKLQQSENRTRIVKTILEADDGAIPFLFGLLAFMLIPLALLAIPTCGHEWKVAKLEGLEEQIQKDIEAGNYDEALAKTNQMTLTDNYSGDDEKTWEKKRKEYQSTIRDLIKEENAANPDYLYAPKSSEDFKKLSRQEAVDLFRQTGFTNISEIEVPDDTGFWIFGKKSGKVEHVVFGGLTDFSTEDGCMAGDKVVIYYYAEKE